MSRAVDQSALLEQLNAAYAAGGVAPALALLAETRAAMDRSAGRDLALAEATAADAFEREAPVALKRDALERVLARAAQRPQERPRQASPADALDAELSALPAPARRAVLEAIQARKWGGGLGVRSLLLLESHGWKAELLRLEPGDGAPRHTHEGLEYTLVLTGAFDDGLARYVPGDIAVADPSVTHRPIAEPGAICFALAVSEAPLKFTGALGVLQKIWRH